MIHESSGGGPVVLSALQYNVGHWSHFYSKIPIRPFMIVINSL